MGQPSFQLPAEEAQARISQLFAAPWQAAGRLAEQTLTAARPAAPVRNTLLARPDGRRMPLAQATATLQRAEAQVRAWLRPHWEEPVTKEQQARLRFRHSLDEALTDLQLTELAIQNGYVALDDVRAAVGAKVRRLLWSPAVVQYLVDYSFVNVWALLARLGVANQLAGANPAAREMAAQVRVPAVDPAGQVRFAAFLSQYRSWYQNPDLDLFLKLCDDYTFPVAPSPADRRETVDLLDLPAFVAAGYAACLTDEPAGAGPGGPLGSRPALLMRATNGLQDFVASLTALVEPFTGASSRGVGAFFAYWLAKFNGYSLRGPQAIANTVDWTQAPLPPPLLFYLTTGTLLTGEEGADARVGAGLMQEQQRQLLRLRQLWQETAAATGIQPEKRRVD